jgi:hypothetical protein
VPTMQRRPPCGLERRALAALVVGFLTLVLPAAPAPGGLASGRVETEVLADGTSLGTVSNSGARISWSRAIGGGETQVLLLDVALPPDEWERPGGVFVGVHYPGSQSALDADMGLTVTAPDGTRTVSPNGSISGSCCSDTESVRLPSPPNGTYRIEVSSDNDVSYEGLAMVQHESPTPARDLLPDLTTPAPDRVLFGDFLLGSCSREEFPEGARRCLRFDLAAANFGDGPLEVRVGGVDTSGKVRASQRVYRSDGTFSERDAGAFSFHAFHGHFHFDDFWLAQLWASDADGNRLGSQPVRTGSKNGAGACDGLNPWFGQRHTAPRAYSCDNPHTLPLLEFGGISVGWVEVYPMDLQGNHVEVSGVPDGSYVLRLITDPDDKLLELDETNNALCQPISLGPGDTATKTGAAYPC